MKGPQDPDTGPAPAAAVWLFGLQQATVNVETDAYEAWMGRSLAEQREFGIYSGISSNAVDWTQFESGRGSAGFHWTNTLNKLDTQIPIAHSYGMFPTVITNRNFVRPQSWDEFAAGDFDGHYQVLAQNWKTDIVNAGRDGNGGSIIVRLGWEMSGNWYPHSVGDKVAEFKASWERAVAILKGEMPDLRFEFGPAKEKMGVARNVSYADSLPDLSTVDYFGRSHHDGSGLAKQAVDEASWITFYENATSTETGLTEWAALGLSLNRPLAFGEWRPQITNGCGPDWPMSQDPEFFIRRTFEWMLAHRTQIAYDVYLDSGCSSLFSRQTHPAAIAYKELWTTIHP